jgi:phosphatidylinositol kinase/protein kinase (PI-3  family)
MRGFSIELLKESPSPALRACSTLAQKYHPLAHELFNAAFVSCWGELHDHSQDELITALETAFKATNIPSEVVQTLLHLTEFMARDAKRLPLDIRTLASLAEKCHAYASALHYQEKIFLEREFSSPRFACLMLCACCLFLLVSCFLLCSIRCVCLRFLSSSSHTRFLSSRVYLFRFSVPVSKP